MTAASSLTSVLIVGTGFMGSSIAYLIATKTKADVNLWDNSSNALSQAISTIEKIGESSVDKGFINKENWEDAKNRIVKIKDFKNLPSCQFVLEAIYEDLKTKRELFKSLDQSLPKETIFASNTSSLPITTLASATQRSDRFIGMHFFSPPHIMKLLEIIPGLNTADSTMAFASDLGKSLGKEIISSKDLPGFITTRLGMVLLNEAAFALMEGLSKPQEIDMAMTLGYNHPMGPLALADFIGLDICLHAMETLYQGFGDPKYRPCPLLRQLVAAGHLGRKSGNGFYSYAGAC